MPYASCEEAVDSLHEEWNCVGPEYHVGTKQQIKITVSVGEFFRFTFAPA